jgi:hypothetical protein
MIVQTTTNITGAGCSSAYLNGTAASFFDRMWVTGQSGANIEEIQEYGLVTKNLLELQMDGSSRDASALQYGLNVEAPNTAGLQGHPIGILNATTVGYGSNYASYSYSIPLISSCIGVTADKFLNVGRTNKLTLNLQTSPVLPFILTTAGTVTAGAFTVTIQDIFLSCEFIDIGHSALGLFDGSLVDGKHSCVELLTALPPGFYLPAQQAK